MSSRNRITPWQRARIISLNTPDTGRLVWVRKVKLLSTDPAHIMATNIRTDGAAWISHRPESLELLPEFAEWVESVSYADWRALGLAGDPEQARYLNN
jgi:hypothetical protein